MMNPVLQYPGNSDVGVSSAASFRTVTRLIDAQRTTVGEGLNVRRALPDPETHSVGPWVFLDHFGPQLNKSSSRGVPPHPHAGIETVTLLLEGGMKHRDSAGNEGAVFAGGAQWMTAGRGIVHAEQPFGNGSSDDYILHGVQLWTTLPRALKMMTPRYQNLDAASIPVVKGEGWQARIFAGEFESGTQTRNGPAQTQMPMFLWHLTLDPRAQFTAASPAGMEAAVYVISGNVEIGVPIRNAAVGQLAVLDQIRNGIIVANASDVSAEVLILGGVAAEGPLVFHGPFVMNSIEQVRSREKAYMTGEMGSLAE